MRSWTVWTGPGQRADGEAVDFPAAICLPIDRASIPWDGVPASIPTRVQRLYADTPEPKRPIGWRALLISSCEVLKLHFPETLGEPNGIPTAEAMHWGTHVGDLHAAALCLPSID